MGGNIFAPDEVLKLAIEIEKNGQEFYASMANKVKDEKLKDTLNLLANEEEKHKKVFEDILESLGETEVVETYAGEYQAYMKALADECVFTQDILKKKKDEGFDKTVDLLDFALRIEKDSIILYSEMKENLLGNQDVLDKVIEEERKHFIMISELKEQYK
jgi:rubrerythrin